MSLTLSNAAIAMIHGLLTDSGLDEPVPSLCDMGSLPKGQDPAELHALAESADIAGDSEVRRFVEGIDRKLWVNVFERTACDPGDFIQVGPLEFAIPANLRVLLADSHLHYEHGELILERGGQIYASISSLVPSL
jgi:hypothetical protein